MDDLVNFDYSGNPTYLMNFGVWRCFRVGKINVDQDEVYEKADSVHDSESGICSLSSLNGDVDARSVCSLPEYLSATVRNSKLVERQTKSFDYCSSEEPGSSEHSISTFDNPLFLHSRIVIKRKIRIMMAGDHQVGKSCLMLRFLYNTFISRYNRTTETVKNVMRRVYKHYYTIEVLDLGADRIQNCEFSDLGGLVDGIIFVYSVDNYNSYEKLDKSLNTINSTSNNDDIVRVVLGNKTDLSRKVCSSLGQKTSRRINASFAEVSAKNAEGVKEVFTELISRILLNEVQFD